MLSFEVAGGSVPGSDHTMPGQPGWTNNQDAYTWIQNDRYLLAVVADGCSSGDDSEVGAKLGSKLFISYLSRCLDNFVSLSVPCVIDALEWAKSFAARDIKQLVETIAGEEPKGFAEVLLNHFLFTLMGTVVNEENTVVFSLGDGVYAVNGDVQTIPPYPNNAPPYLGFCALPEGVYKGNLDMVIRASLPTKDVEHVLIGSDGVSDLIAAAAMPLPGKTELLGPLSQFWENDKFFKNEDMIRRRLAMASHERAVEGRISKGLFPDDTTLVVVRRTKTEE